MTTKAVEEDTTLSTNQPIPSQSTNENTFSMDDENSVKLPPFDLAEPFDISFLAPTPRGKRKVRHIIKRASFQDLQNRNMSQPYRSQEKGDIETPLPNDDNKVDVKLYEKLIIETFGYPKNVKPGQSPEERAEALSKTNIKTRHKTDALQATLGVTSKVVYDELSGDEASEEIEVESWGEDLTYIIEASLGVDGQFKVRFYMKEPSETQAADYRKCVKYEIEKGTERDPIQRVRVDLRPAVIVFDQLVEKVEGFVVSGEPFDVENPAHLQLIDAYTKRSVMEQLMKQTQLDLGK